ncbi:MAG TPA: DUF6600 domain-containing protein [Steroidobacteraceae bacterium]|jgi:hypothetical protein|nr:DUF6600 domain-containing protein [Steroidobacteraceae bacterium]
MITKHQTMGGIAVVLALIFLQPAIAAADEVDPPTRVARLAYADGSVSFQPGGTQDWVSAVINRPLTTGDQLWADSDSRAELELDGSSLRLSGRTAVSLLNLADDVTQIQLSSGTLLIRVRRLDDNETYEIDTPNLAFSILRPGVYRLTVDPSGASTTVGVRSGQGEVTGNGSAYTVRANEEDVFSGTDQLAEVSQSRAPPEDAFDAWSTDRDGRYEHSESARYVSPDIVGYQDLDDQGSWRPTPDYGNVWFPTRVAPGWAPYHTGHWSYIPPWGYTWVDDQPWGFAPFHYGRWIWFHEAWGWIPTPPRPAFGVYVRPVYAPALVAWVGAGAGVAWFALGPREVYVPSYPVSRRYVNQINISNTNVNTTVINNVYNTTVINNKTVNITNVNYANRNVRGAIASTTSQAFSSAQPVSRNLARVDERELASAPVRAFAPATVPTKQAVLGAGRLVSAKPPASVETRTVVARASPPPPQPAFEQREQAIRANQGKPLSVNQVRQIQSSEPSRVAPVRLAPAVTPVQTGGLAPRPGAAVGEPPQQRPPPPPVPSNRGGPSPAPVAVHPNELPAVPKPASPGVANTMLERSHLQQQQQLQAQQEQERQRIQQQQELAHQQLEKQQADAARKEQAAQQQRAQQAAEQQQQQRAQQAAEQQRAQQQQAAAQQQQAAAQQQQRAQQAAEQQRAQQQQELARQQQARQQADEARKQELEQQHQQQTQQLAQQHALEMQQLQQKQQAERQQQEKQTKPANPKDDKRPPTH